MHLDLECQSYFNLTGGKWGRRADEIRGGGRGREQFENLLTPPFLHEGI